MGRLVLVVDDDNEIRQMMCLLLKLHGYETAEAVDGVDALAKINQRQPDLIVLDVMMPKMDGITLCKTLRDDLLTARLPIIMLSGKTTPRAVEEGLEAGADRYLTKPSGLDVLTQTIGDVLQDSLTEQRSG